MSFPLASLALRVGVAVLVCLAVWSMANALRPDGKREPVRAQAVALVDERPPEPPPEILKPLPEPEPMEYEELIEADTPELPDVETADMIDDRLGIDGIGQAGADAFGLVAKRGGRSLLKTARQRHDLTKLGAMIEDHLTTALGGQSELLRHNFSVFVAIWVDRSGFVERVRANSTGDALLDEAIAAALRNVPPFRSRLGEVPQPIRLRIITRGARAG